ncbi:MAG: hypothetical protein ACR2P7_07770 [bacterium]
MRRMRVGAVVEAALWLSLAAFLYAYSFDFDREIEIYKFGASAWPRAILLLIAIAAIGQLAHHWHAARRGERDAIESQSAPDASTSRIEQDAIESHAEQSATESPSAVSRTAESTAAQTSRGALKWHLSTFALIALPFAYIVLPSALQSWLALDKSALHALKLICAGALIALYLFGLRGNLVGAILALPIFFGALMQDFGFYALAPAFAVGVMYLMGERRPGWIALVAAIIVALLLLLFVGVLYVGLPTGNISPFYEFGTGIVNLLQ